MGTLAVPASADPSSEFQIPRGPGGESPEDLRKIGKTSSEVLPPDDQRSRVPAKAASTVEEVHVAVNVDPVPAKVSSPIDTNSTSAGAAEAAAVDPNATNSGPCVSYLASEGIHERCGVMKVFSSDVSFWGKEKRTQLQKATFEDTRWSNALSFMDENYFKERDEVSKDQVVRELLTLGASTFGLWAMSDEALNPLVNQVLRTPGKSMISPGMAALDEQRSLENTVSAGRLSKKVLAKAATMSDKTVSKELNDKKDRQKEIKNYARRKITTLADPTSTKALKAFIVIFLFVFCNAYALKVVLHTYPDAVDCFHWPIYIARGCGMACALLSGALYFYISRSVWKSFYTWVEPGGFISGLIDMHKDLHMWVGHCLWYAGALHSLAHLVGTAPGVHATGYEDLNKLLGCANPDTTPDYLGVRIEFLQWPKCPLEQDVSYTDVLFRSTVGISGLLLLALMCATRYTATAAFRKANFDVFMRVHEIAIFSWPLLLFIHGSNGWIGIGFPLIAFTGGIPLSFYAIDRILRFLRYYLFIGRATRIVEATVRPGKKGGAAGALTNIKISKPNFLWQFWPGTYAFICIPSIAATQWHPFTICSGQDDEHVEFLIHAAGDWTTALAKACMEAKTSQHFPRVALDGPFPSPAQSALSRQTLVAVGAGVGITPFLSLMATIISEVVGNKRRRGHLDREAHFYWMSRSADEFLFGRKLFTEIARHPVLRETVFLHLHITAQAADQDPASFIFREAIKRQSKEDKAVFQKWLDAEENPEAFAGHHTPWGWVNSTNQDVMWVNDLVMTPSESVAPASNFIEVKEERIVRSTSSKSSLTKSLAGYEPHELNTEASRLFPVYFGRPEFATEVRQIGKQRPDIDVHVYVCGADAIVKNLEGVVQVCNDHAARDFQQNGGSRKQCYFLHHERFG